MSGGDDFARLRAELDQARAGMKELGGNLRAFYEGLVEAGFSRREAFSLTATALAAMLHGANPGAPGDES